MTESIFTCPKCAKKNRLGNFPGPNLMACCGSCGFPLFFWEINSIYSKLENHQHHKACLLCVEEFEPILTLTNLDKVHRKCINSFERVIDAHTVLTDDLKSLKRDLESQQSKRIDLWSRLFRRMQERIEKEKIVVAERLLAVGAQIAALNEKVGEARNLLTAIYDFWPDYPPDWKQRSDTAIREAGNKCSACNSKGTLQAHHRQLLRLGGSNRIENLQVLCYDCHTKLHGKDHFQIEPPGIKKPVDNNELSTKVMDIRGAQFAGKTIKITYRNKKNLITKRNVHPLRLYNEFGIDYLEAFCHLRNEKRTFRLSRIISYTCEE